MVKPPDVRYFVSTVKDWVTSDYARLFMVIVLTLTVAYLFGTSKPVPSELLTAWGLVLGYYFGKGV